MEGDKPDPNALLQRLNEIPGYTWDLNCTPFHSSYDNWHFFGKQHAVPDPHSASASPVQANRATPPRVPSNETRPPLRAHKSSNSETSVATAINDKDTEPEPRWVVARVSVHALRLEREYRISKLIIAQSDANLKHFVAPIEFVRLPSRRESDQALVVSIFECPGDNYLKDVVQLGPNAYKLNQGAGTTLERAEFEHGEVPLAVFLDFAVGAAGALEILHHQFRLVHGELRGDAFHFNRETGAVKMINFGNGSRSFENGLTSHGWNSLNRQVDIQHKLQFVV